MKYKNTVVYFFCLILFACSNNKNPYQNNLGIEASVLAEMDTANYTYIKWQDTVCNFGNIKSGDSVTCKFNFVNTGITPLFIFDTRITCGCTVTDFPKEPVMPGKPGVVTVIYKSGTQSGEINKQVLVIANTKKSKASRLNIRGSIMPAQK